MLQAKHLTKRYTLGRFSQKGLAFSRHPGTVLALDDVSFALTPGIYGLLGPNGAGKSTLINILTCLLRPNNGGVTWEGVEIQKLGRQYSRMLGYMPQQQGLYQNFTGRSFLAYFCALKGIPDKRVKAETQMVADKVNLAGELDKRILAYSGGMKQRLLVASCFIGKPKLIIMDEPTAGLDPKERVRFRGLIQEAAADKIVLVATHVVADVESVAKKIMLLKAGQLVDCDAPESLIAKYAPEGSLEDVYLQVFGEER